MRDHKGVTFFWTDIPSVTAMSRPAMESVHNRRRAEFSDQTALATFLRPFAAPTPGHKAADSGARIIGYPDD